MGTSHRHRTLAAAVASLLLVPLGGGGVAHAVAPPDAPTEVLCTETLTATTIPGDVRVPAGARCVVTRAAIGGDLVLEAEAAVNLTRSTVKGDVHQGRDAFVNLAASTVWHGVHGDDSANLVLDDSTVLRSIRGTFSGVWVLRSRVLGAINVARPEAQALRASANLHDSLVGGWVSLRSVYVSLQDADLGRGLTIQSPAGVGMCDTTVDGDARVASSTHVVDIGSQVCLRLAESDRFEDGEPGTRRGNRIDGSLHLLDNAWSVTVRRTMVAGDLECSGNRGGAGADTHHSTVRVTGARSGQCT